MRDERDEDVPDNAVIDASGEEDAISGWVLAASGGDARAWDLLVKRFAGLVWSICRAHRLSAEDAADVSQLTWLRLLENLDRIRDPRRLPGWLATTCRRECLALQRRARSSLAVEDDHLDRLLGGVPGADRKILTDDQYAVLWEAFLKLSEWCQRILRTLVIDADEGPPSYRQVADQLKVPVGSLGPTRARCLDQLRKLLDSGGI
jgi:RNA polymerase sigma factor (sigma-70 family)